MFFPKIPLYLPRGRQGGVRGGTAAFATMSEFPLDPFSVCPFWKKDIINFIIL